MPVSPENLSHVELFGLARQQVLTGKSLVSSGENAVESLARRIAMHEVDLGDPITNFAVMRFGADASPENITFFRGIQNDVASHVGELCALVTETPDGMFSKGHSKIGLLTAPSLIVEAQPYPGKGVKARLSLPVSAYVGTNISSIRTLNLNSVAYRSVLTSDDEMRIDLGGKTVYGDASLDISAPYRFALLDTSVRRIIVGDDLVGTWYDVKGRPRSDTSSALKERLVSAVQYAVQHTSQRSATHPEVAQAR